MFQTTKVINPSTFASLSNFQAIFLQALVLVVTSGYGIFHLFYDKKEIGVVALVSAVFSFLCIWSIYKRKLNGYYFIIFFLSQFVCLIFTSYYYGLRGLILIFPVSASAFYVFYYRLAFYSSLIMIISALVASANVLETSMLIRMAIALFLSITFLAAFSYVVTSQYQSLEYDANHDHLTNLLNRRGFTRWMKKTLRSAQAAETSITLFHLDLDGFKSINDNFGQSCGDELLVALPNRVLSILRTALHTNGRNDPCHLARLSGDEFALVIEGLDARGAAQSVAMRIIDSVTEPFNIHNSELRISISVGIASASESNYRFSTLLSHASAALREAKQLGKNGYCYFDEAIANKQKSQHEIEQILRTALDEDGFTMVYQPIYHCDDQQLKGVEALIRCSAASAIGSYPDTFIPIAENAGLIRRLDLWVIEAVFKAVCSLPEGHDFRELEYSINISALELHNNLFPNKLRSLLAQYPVNVTKIQLEITETSLIALDERCMNILRELSAIGVRLALDDFGMGYTAFNQLRKYPVHTLKIDRSFIMDLDDGKEQAAEMIELIMSLASLYGLKVVAEGVETQEQLTFLKTTRCDFVQGYYLSRPMVWEALLSLPKSTPSSGSVTLISRIFPAK